MYVVRHRTAIVCANTIRPSPISVLSVPTKPSDSHNVRILSEMYGPPQNEGTNVDDKGSEVQGGGGPTLANHPHTKLLTPSSAALAT